MFVTLILREYVVLKALKGYMFTCKIILWGEFFIKIEFKKIILKNGAKRG